MSPSDVNRFMKNVNIASFIAVDESTDSLFFYNSILNAFEKRQIPKEESKNRELERTMDTMGKMLKGRI